MKESSAMTETTLSTTRAATTAHRLSAPHSARTCSELAVRKAAIASSASAAGARVSGTDRVRRAKASTAPAANAPLRIDAAWHSPTRMVSACRRACAKSSGAMCTWEFPPMDAARSPTSVSAVPVYLPTRPLQCTRPARHLLARLSRQLPLLLLSALIWTAMNSPMRSAEV